MVQYKSGRKSPWMVQIRDSSGKVITHSFARKDLAQEFERKERDKRQCFAAGMEAPREEILLIDYAKTFLKRRFKGEVVLSTVKQDEGRLRNYWLEKFGKRPLTTISSSEIKQHLDHIQFELDHSPADRNRHRALMHRFFKLALMDGKVLYNPVSPIELIEEKRTKKRIVLKDADQVEVYLKALHQESPHYGMIGEIMVWTGARVCEAIALQYQDILEDENVVLIRRIEERAGGSKIVERTKGAGSINNDEDALAVPLFPRLRQAIQAHRMRSCYLKPTHFIGCRPDGKYIPYDTFKDVHTRVIKETGLPPITPHSLRSSFATIAKKHGYTRVEIMEMLGHSSEAVTARYDRKDIQHLIDKGKRIGFGTTQPGVVSLVEAK